MIPMIKLPLHLNLLISILLICIFFLSGCAVNNPQKIESTSPAAAMTEDLQQKSGKESPYYHFTRYELHKNKREFDQALAELMAAVQEDPGSIFLKKELISIHLHLKNTVKAMDVAQTLTDKHPENTEFLIILAKLKQMNKQDTEAREIYQKVLQLEPDNENIYLALGRMYMDNSNTSEAFRLYTNMAIHFPNSYVAHFFLGKIHMEKQNPEYAEKEFLKTLELSPKLVEPRFQLIRIYQSQEGESKNPDPRILSFFNKILDIEPKNLRAELELALYHHHHGKKEIAAELLAKTGKRSLTVPMQGMSMVVAKEFIDAKRYKDASIIFSGMLKGAPEDSSLNYFAGIAYDSLKQYKKAIKYFLKVKQNSDHYKKIIVHVAFLYNENNQLDKAISFLEQKHQELPEDIDIMLYLGSFYEDNKEYPKALEILSKGAALSSDNSTILFRLGIIQDKSNMKKACITTMEQVIQLEPENASALNYLGYTLADLGKNLDKAEALIKKALTIKPDDGFITDSLGWVYFKKGQYTKAIELLNKAAQLTSFDPVITEHLGDAYEKNNLLEKALEMYRKALSKQKETNPELNQKIKKLEGLLHGPE